MPVWIRAALLVAVGSGPAPASHPLHSTLAEIEYQAKSGSVLIRVRAFRDDLAAATSGSSDSLLADSVLSRYVRERLTLSDGNGRQCRPSFGAASDRDSCAVKLCAFVTLWPIPGLLLPSSCLRAFVAGVWSLW